MTDLLPGAEPMSHVGSLPAGALVIHGLTSNPGSMRGVADAFAAAGFHVEQPLLPGHGTVIEDLLPKRWADWVATAEAAYQTLAARLAATSPSAPIVVVGLSLGGALTLRMGADHPEIAGLVCINPVAQPQPAEIVEMLQGMIDSGTELLPGVGGDIADPEATESAYAGTPLRALLSLLTDGVTPLSAVYPAMRMPLLLLNSPQDHVVEPVQAQYLADNFGGPVERITLERSYHVATLDYDKETIRKAAVEFALRVTEVAK